MNTGVAAASMPAVGDQLGKYRISGRLGEGSVGVVYRAVDTSLGRDVALKVLRPQFAVDAEVQSRFLDEARLTARLDDHPNIVSIYDIGQERGFLYLAMRLHEGPSLANLLQDLGHLPLGRTVNIIAQVAAALDFAHRAGVVHRDVKPGNIMIGPDDQATLTDFGLAKAMSQSLGKTVVGTVMGTPHYMSPEQIKGESVGPATDIYSLGITAYQMLSGILPHDADSMAAILYRQAHTDMPPLKLPDQPRCAARVDAVLRRALHKDPSRRWSSAQAFAQALGEAVANCGAMPTPVGRYKVAVAAVVGLAVLGVGVGLALRRSSLSNDPPQSGSPASTGGSSGDRQRQIADPGLLGQDLADPTAPSTDTPEPRDVGSSKSSTPPSEQGLGARATSGSIPSPNASGRATDTAVVSGRVTATVSPQLKRPRLWPSPSPSVTVTAAGPTVPPPAVENPTDEPKEEPTSEPQPETTKEPKPGGPPPPK